jgi:hypothetical protein
MSQSTFCFAEHFFDEVSSQKERKTKSAQRSDGFLLRFIPKNLKTRRGERFDYQESFAALSD